MRTLTALVVFTNWLPNARDDADKTAGYTPFPLNGKVWGEVEELSFTLRVPVLAPRAAGVKVTEILQLAPAASVLGAIGHFEVSAKSPDTEMLLMLSDTVCGLLRVTTLAVLVVCISQFPNATMVGVKVCACAVGTG